MAKKKETSKPNVYSIYGIISIKEKKLIYVDISMDNVELEFDIQDYDEDLFAMVEFSVELI